MAFESPKRTKKQSGDRSEELDATTEALEGL